MMCVEESLIVHSSSNSNKNNNSSNNSTPSNPPSSSSSAVDKLNSSGGTTDHFPRQRQPGVVQWAKCLHCPRTWKCRDQPDDPSEARFILDVPYQGLTKFVPCNECKPPSLPATTSNGQQQQQSKQIESNNQATANMLLQQFAANPILSAGLGLNSATQQQSMNMFNLLPLLYQQMQQNANASRLPGIIATAGQAELFQSMLQQTLLQQQGSDGGKKHPVAPPKRDNHYRQPPARAPKEDAKPQQAANNMDLNRTRMALAAKPTSSSGLQLDERRLTSILEAATRPYLTSSGTGTDDKLKTSQMLRFNGASELCKRLEDKDQTKKFTSPAMQSLAEIGRSPGAIWNGGGGGVESGHSDAGGVETSHFPCATCGKSFKNRSLLKIHQRAHVTSDGQHKCHVCDYVTADAHALVAHMQRRHSGAVDTTSPSSNGGGAYGNGSHQHQQQQQQQQQEAASPVKCKPAICPVCGRKSPSLGYLKIHMRSHKTTLDHVCHVCGRGFKEHWYLTTHLRTHDKGLVNGHHHPHHHPHHAQFGTSNAAPTAPQRQVQHNEVQQQLRLMIERNQRNSEAYRVALKSAAASTAANPLFPMPAPTNGGGGCRSLSGHSGDDCCSSATPSPPMRNEEDSLESRNRAVSKRKAFHPVKCSQNEAGTEPPAAKRLATEAAVAGMTMAPHHHQQQQHDDQQVFGRRKSKPQKLDVVEGADMIDLSLVKEESGTISEEENKVVRPLVHKHHLRLASDTRESSSSSSSQPLDLRVLKLSDGSSSKSISPASNGRSVSF